VLFFDFSVKVTAAILLYIIGKVDKNFKIPVMTSGIVRRKEHLSAKSDCETIKK